MRTPEQLEWQATSDAHGPNFAPTDDPVRLVVFGAVPVTAALVRLARATGWLPYVVDPRARLADAASFPGAERVLAAWPDEAFSQLGGIDSTTAVVAATHAPELDDEALVLALRSEAFYVGAIGSRNTQRRRRERLTEAGCSDDELARLSGPAGLDLGGETVDEAALAILAEAVALLRGRSGGRLTGSDNAIHVGGRP